MTMKPRTRTKKNQKRKKDLDHLHELLRVHPATNHDLNRVHDLDQDQNHNRVRDRLQSRDQDHRQSPNHVLVQPRDRVLNRAKIHALAHHLDHDLVQSRNLDLQDRLVEVVVAKVPRNQSKNVYISFVIK